MTSSADWLKALKSDLTCEWEAHLKLPLSKLVSPGAGTVSAANHRLGSNSVFRVGMVWDPKYADEDLANEVTAFWVPTGIQGPTSEWRAAHSEVSVFFQNQPEKRIDLKWMHDQGSSRVTEIAWLMCCLEHAKTAGKQAASEVRVAMDASLFLNVAVLRLIEILYLEAGFKRPILSAWTSQRGFSTLDPWNNSLRASGSAASAIWGNADVVFVSPFDAVTGQKDHWGRRLARNTGLILRQESHLSRTIDPANGSYAVEALMRELRAQAEPLKARLLSEGFESMIAADRAILEAKWNEGTPTLIGVNRFQNSVPEPRGQESEESRGTYRWARKVETP